MNLECIVAFANRKFQLFFNAMERSLRNVGCDLPLRVIPHPGEPCELPARAEFWNMEELSNWYEAIGAHPRSRKFQCLTIKNYQFVDCDLIFLRDPAKALEPHSGFITSDMHWHTPNHTTTPESEAYFLSQSTIWQSRVFNSGQFACDEIMYDVEALKAKLREPLADKVALQCPFHEQPGMNLLVWDSGVPVKNLTMPPTNMQSTWGGDYRHSYRNYWKTEEETPYLLHWAGQELFADNACNELFFEYLTKAEREDFELFKRDWLARDWRARNSPRGWLRRIKRGVLQAMRSG